MTDPWQERRVIGDCELYLGDSLQVLPMLDNVDSVVTDPPYGIAYSSGYATDALWKGGRSIANDKNTDVRDEVLAFWKGCSNPRIVFGSRKVFPPQETRMVLIWDKGPALGMGALDLPWKPSYEEVYILGSRYVGARDEGAVIYCPPVQSMAKNGRTHPNEKPVSLIYRLLKKIPDGVTLDPFMGSGTTGVACAKLGRRFIGIEIDRDYFEIACKRIEDAYKQPDFFVQSQQPKAEQLSLDPEE